MKKIITLIFLLIQFVLTFAQNPSEPKIGTLDGKQYICINKDKPTINVKIEVPNGYSKTIDHFEIEWFILGGSTIKKIVVPASYNPPIQSIDFDLSSFFGSCLDSVRGDITVYTYIVGENEPVNNGFKPTFRQPPVAKINKDSLFTCIGESFQFDGTQSCPSNVSDFQWTIEGNVINGEIVNYTFLTPGPKKVKLKVTNICGSDEDEIDITVRPLPIANASANANLVSNVYEICLNDNDKGVIIVDGSSSLNANKYEWFVLDSSSSNYTINEHYIGPILQPKMKKIIFKSKGKYRIVLKVSMPCNYPDYDTITVNVIDREPVYLKPISDTCGPISYSPPSNISGSKYFINGSLQSTFPITLTKGNYKVKVTYQNTCGPSADSISFKVFEPSETKFILPTKDTTVCKGSGRFKIEGSPVGGNFDPSPYLEISGNETFFRPSAIGTFTLKYNTGVGNCLRSASRTINVIDALVFNLTPQPDVCNSVSYTPTPFFSNATYKINGSSISNFPYLINSVGKNYITATLSNQCGIIELKDTFELIKSKQVNFLSPLNDTIICKDSPEFEIKVNIYGGRFSPASKVIERNGKYYFKPTISESFNLKYDYGFDACASSSSKKITIIEGVPLSLNPQADVCNTITYTPQPFQNLATYKINGQVVSNSDFPKTLNTPRQYIIEAYLKNECGEKTIKDTFFVTQPEVVKFLSPISDTILCKGTPEFEIKVNILGGTMNSVQGLTERNGKYFFNPSQTGDFNLTYKQGIGSCERTASVKIKVVEGVPLSLNPQVDVCNTIAFTPQPFQNLATYKINGQVVSNSDFPKTLNTPGQYIIEAYLKNECGDKTIKDTFFVTQPEVVKLLTPISDTVLCKGSPEFEVKVSIYGGSMTSIQGLSERNGKYFFNPAQTGEFTLSYRQGIANCERKDSIKIKVVEGVPLDLNPQADVCNSVSFKPSPFQALATYKINGQVVSNSDFPKTLNTQGQYIIEAYLKNECGEKIIKDTFEIKITKNAKISYPKSDTVVCTNSNKFQIIGSIIGGTFKPVSTIETKGDTAYLDISNPGSYEIIYSEGFGDCFSSDTVTIKVEEGKILELNPQPNVCEPFIFKVSPFNNFATYQINNQPYNGLETNLNSGLYTVKATLKDVCSIKEDSITFNVFGNNDLFIIGTRDTQICINTSPIKLTSSIQGGVFQGDHLLILNDQLFFEPSFPGIFKIKLSLDLNNCTLFDSVIIEVIGLSPKIDDIRVCLGTDSLLLVGTPLNGNWGSINCPECINDNIFNLNKLQGLQSDYTYTLKNNIGCIAVDTASITLLNPISSFTISGPACSSGVNIDSSLSISENNYWLIDSMPYGFPPFANLSNGKHIITLISNIEKCFDTSSVEIYIINPPIESADFKIRENQVCSPYNLNLNFTYPIQDFLEYKWEILYNDTLTEFKGFDFPGISLINDSPFKKKVKITSYSFNSCDTISKIDSLYILGIPKSEIGIDSNRKGCSPYTINISNRSIGEIDSCVWTINGRKYITCNPYITQTFVANDTTTRFPIELKVYNKCANTVDYDTITVIPPGIDAFYNTTKYDVCPNEEVIFEDASSPIPNNWYWSFGDGTISTEQNPIHIFKEEDKSFDVTLFVSNGCGYDSIRRTINTGKIPNIDFSLPIYACQFQSSDSIIQLSYQNGQRFIWDFGDGQKDSTNINPKPIFQSPGLLNVSLQVRDRNFSCPGFLAKLLEVKNKPSANFLLDSLICFGKEIVIPNSTMFANDYVWIYDNIPIQGTENPLIIFKESGEHIIKLIASYNNKCIDSIQKIVFVQRCDVYIPNLFTPNNDGKNDFFTAYGGVNVRLIRKISIFDRWGELVFKNENISPNIDYLGWDGSLNTRSKSFGLNSGVFIYFIEIEFEDGSVESFKGDVTLLR